MNTVKIEMPVKYKHHMQKMPCSICGKKGHNRKTCGQVSQIVTIPRIIPKIEIPKKQSDTPGQVTAISQLMESSSKTSNETVIISCAKPLTSISDTNVTQQILSIIIDKFINVVQKINNPQIILLANREVLRWLIGDLSFLPQSIAKTKQLIQSQMKANEDVWGRKVMKIKRPDLQLAQQWTNKFGEYICEELCLLLHMTLLKPEVKQHHKPDVETTNFIWEAKAETFFTTGTAGEKILGVPFKYADIPELYGKPLRIICIGGAEKICREQYGNLPESDTQIFNISHDKVRTVCSQKIKFLKFFKENQIEFLGASDLIGTIANSK
ncbi:MAG: hypothetical protein M0R33_17200 [Methylomonas sp.]|jgi:hypothetical protein|uniref:hypothetical protein n=1 Tax=Methylomonas sp. TaxID=418 RepID=UPI0025FDB95F|nr:hypothetical protein [Methylomonas sp.]MCK9608184.1 hypothetical protein [Methylomonas sp.]